MKHSLVAGCTLNLLYQIKKIGDLKNACNFEKSLYTIFLEEVLSSVEQFKKKQLYDEQDGFNEICGQDDLIENSMNLIGSCATNLSPSFDDKFLFMVFNCNLKEIGEETNLSETEGNITIDKLQNKLNVLDIFEKLNAISNTILPLEEIVIKCMSNILQTRISFANRFVISMYRDEFEISKHFQNIRRVLLLESSDLMHSFYIKLFIQIESGKSWANPFLLTVQLDDIICSKFAHMSSLFRIEIDSTYRSQNSKVTEAVEELLIKYDIKKELQNIITQKSMEEYNKVFRFLLKVKWGLWSLENLSFPASHKKRPPYAVFEMSDLLMRRLEQLRFWLMYSIQCVHFHLMTHVLQSMGQQLDKKIKYCKNVTEMKSVHESYIETVCEHCFTEKKSADIKIGIEQLLCLVYVLKLEWHSFVREIESNDTDNDSGVQGNDPNYILSSQVEAIENTYIRCHQYLARILNHEVYSKQNSYLSGLSAAFNTSIPY